MSQVDGAPAAQQVPAGWYPDHTGEPRMRWWDGQQWTEHVSQPTPVAATYPDARPFQPVPDGAPMGNVFIWILVCLPVVSIVQILLTTGSSVARAGSLSVGGSTAFAASQFSDPAYLLGGLAGYLIAAAAIVLSYFDWRTLKKVGVDRPFHWAWAFFAIIGVGIVYVIGRSIIVHRRSGRGLAPLWVHIGLAVAYLVVAGIFEAQLVSAVFHNLPSYGTPYTNT